MWWYAGVINGYTSVFAALLQENEFCYDLSEFQHE